MLGAQVKRSAFVEPRGPIATSGRSEKRRKEKKGGECVRKERKRKERKSFFLFFFVVELLISTIEIVSARVANFVESRKARRHRDYWFIEACTAVRRYCISCITRARSSCCYTGICCIGYLAWIQRRDIDRSTRGAIRELVFPNWANYIYICVCIYIYIQAMVIGAFFHRHLLLSFLGKLKVSCDSNALRKLRIRIVFTRSEVI